jgi:hypothetical protein
MQNQLEANCEKQDGDEHSAGVLNKVQLVLDHAFSLELVVEFERFPQMSLHRFPNEEERVKGYPKTY